jgi:hypothetical protein
MAQKRPVKSQHKSSREQSWNDAVYRNAALTCG